MSIVTVDGEQYKVCTKCIATKKIGDFYKNRARPDGFNYICKLCEGEYQKDRRKKKDVTPISKPLPVVKSRELSYEELEKKKVKKFVIPEELNEEIVSSCPFRCPYCQSHCNDKNRVIMKYSGTSPDKMKDIWRGECSDCGREWYWEAIT